MLRAASILHAVFLCFTIAVICGVFLYLFSFHKLNTTQFLVSNDLLDHSDSYFELFLSKRHKSKGNSLIYKDFDPIHCEIKITNWGLFPLVKRKTFFKRDTIFKNTLLGIKLNRQDALYVCDFGEEVKISGNTTINGNVSLPKGRIGTANILGNQFVNNPKINGTILESANQLPLIIDTNFTIPKDAVEVTLEEVMEKVPSGINSFSNPTYLVNVSDLNKLGKIKLKGNYILFSEGYLQISNLAKLEDVIIVAPEVDIERGFEGTIQVFANKNIIVEKKVNLKYPSSLVLNYQSGLESEVYIKVNERATISGNLIMNTKSQEVSKANFFIEEDSKIYGNIYSKGILQLKGEIYGSVYAEKLFYKTDYSEYSDILLNTKIDLQNLDPNFVGAPIIKNDLIKDYAIAKEF